MTQNRTYSIDGRHDVKLQLQTDDVSDGLTRCTLTAYKPGHPSPQATMTADAATRMLTVISQAMRAMLDSRPVTAEHAFNCPPHSERQLAAQRVMTRSLSMTTCAMTEVSFVCSDVAGPAVLTLSGPATIAGETFNFELDVAAQAADELDRVTAEIKEHADRHEQLLTKAASDRWEITPDELAEQLVDQVRAAGHDVTVQQLAKMIAGASYHRACDEPIGWLLSRVHKTLSHDGDNLVRRTRSAVKEAERRLEDVREDLARAEARAQVMAVVARLSEPLIAQEIEEVNAACAELGVEPRVVVEDDGTPPLREDDAATLLSLDRR